MKIDAWRIKAFGPLSGWQVTGLARHDVVIVLGPNESGKSALFEFLTSAMFGFAPATAQDHPYRPWDGAFPEGTLDVILRDGARAHVARRLRSRPEGRLTVNGNEADLANRTVPWVGLLNRAIFTNVHALTQDEALALDPKAWQAVQDRVLGGSSFDFLRPTREVVAELDQRRTGYWRPTRHGRPRDREIRSQIRELRKSLGPASERRALIEQIDQRLRQIETDTRDQEEELRRIQVRLERNDVLAPLLRRVERTRELEGEADLLVPSDELSADVAEQREALYSAAAELREQIVELQGEIREREEAQKLDETVSRLLAWREPIERLDRTVARIEEDRDRIARMDRGLQQSDGALRELAGRVLVSGQMDDRTREIIATVSIAELRGRHRVWTEQFREAQGARAELEHAEAERLRLERELESDEPQQDLRSLDERLRRLRSAQLVAATAPRWPQIPVWTAATSVALGVAGGVAGAVVNGPAGVALLVAGVVLIAGAGASLIAHWAVIRRRSRAESGRHVALPDLPPGVDIADAIERMQQARDDALRRDSLLRDYERAQTLAASAHERSQAAELESTAKGERLSELLAGLPLASVYREAPDDALVRDLEGLRGRIEAARDLREDRAQVAEGIDRFRAEVERMREALALNLPADPIASVLEARRHLEQARELERSARIAAAETSALREQLDEKHDEITKTEAGIARIDHGLGALDPESGDPARGLERLTAARERRAEAQRRRNDFDRETPDWQARVGEAERLRAAGEIVELSDEQRAELRLHAEKLREAGRELAAERGQRGVERANMMKAPGPAHLAGEIAAAEEELELVLREHDRLALLRQLIRTAEQQYRDRYQSPLLESSAAHLKRFTGSRYDWLTVDDAGPSAPQLEVRRRGQEFPEPVATPLSRGTIQQIYFALRLAMVDQVEGEEPLPIFLDEMFVNWDPDRTSGGLDVLARMPRERQIFLFTADPFWAERAEKQVGAYLARTPGQAVPAG